VPQERRSSFLFGDTETTLAVNKARENPKTVSGILGLSRIQTTLDLYSHEDLDEMIAAQEKFLDAVGFESGSVQYELWLGVFGVTSDNSLKRNGGDDGTRTRDLCRDRAAF
jgi:hypothetical protein